MSPRAGRARVRRAPRAEVRRRGDSARRRRGAHLQHPPQDGRRARHRRRVAERQGRQRAGGGGGALHVGPVLRAPDDLYVFDDTYTWSAVFTHQADVDGMVVLLARAESVA